MLHHHIAGEIITFSVIACRDCRRNVIGSEGFLVSYLQRNSQDLHMNALLLGCCGAEGDML